MKFKTIATYLISIAVILSCMVLATDSENKAHREESMMEYMNNFFANSNGIKEMLDRNDSKFREIVNTIK